MTGETDVVTKSSEFQILLSGKRVIEGIEMVVVCVGGSSQAGITKKLILGKAGEKAAAEAKAKDGGK